MFAQTFRFDSSQFRHAFEPRKPRARWLRVLLGVVGLAVLAVLVMFSVFVGAAMIAAGLVFRLWQGRGRPAARERRVVEGEYTVVDSPVDSGVADRTRLPR